MQEQFVEIKTAAGVMDAFVTHPEENGPFPAVILYMDIWGVREELYDIGRRVGTVGYYCLVPDFYYRAAKRLHFEFRNEKNQTISINRLEGEKLCEIQARPKLTNQMVLDDTGAILKFLDGAARRRGSHRFLHGWPLCDGRGRDLPGTFHRVGFAARHDAGLGSRGLAASIGG